MENSRKKTHNKQSSAEWKMVRRDIICIAVLFVLMLAVNLGKQLFIGRSFTAYVDTDASADQVSVSFEDSDQTGESTKTSESQIVDYELAANTPYGLGIRFTAKGAGYVSVTVTVNGNEDYNFFLDVQKDGMIRELNSYNFSGYKVDMVSITVFIILVAVILIRGFFAARKRFHYSYQTMFYGGIGLWVVLCSALMIYTSIEIVANPSYYNMFDFYSYLSNTGVLFMTISLPFIAVFAVFMILSNITLMKRESRRWQNGLGIIIALLMVAGDVLLIVEENADYSCSETVMKVVNCIVDIYCTVFVMLECMLIGAIICGIMAAVHTPSYDQDYIIILGCAIKKDGTLYPLIRGRVDRAIEFYHKQTELTGKSPILIPSGGKGSDEVMSEGRAMEKYLLEQGIPAEHIIVEDQAANTLQNMAFSRKLIEDDLTEKGRLSADDNIDLEKDCYVSFSTTKYHIFRSGILSHQADFDPDGMGSRTKWYFWPNAFLRELIGLISYKKKEVLLLIAICIALYIIVEIGML